MDKMKNSGKWIWGVVIMLVVLGIIVVIPHDRKAAQTAASNTQTSTASLGSPTSSAETASSSSSGSSTAPSVKPAPPVYPPPPSVVINLLTPTPNTQWVIGQQDTISWDAYPNITGQIDLLNASDKSLVGVILSETEAHQTSFSWDTRSYNLGRYGGLLKDVVPGTYIIEVQFDGNNLPKLFSGPVIITS